MRLSSLIAAVILPLAAVSAERVFVSSSLDSCQSNSTFTASLFDIVFTPNNRSLALNVVGDTSATGNVTFKVEASAYGYTFLNEHITACSLKLDTICPLSLVQIDIDTVYKNLSDSVIGKIPSIAYGIPDLDAVVTVHMYALTNPDVSLACVRLRISNGKTVDQAGVRWATALIAIFGLVVSSLVSALGHANAAAHVALYASSLFTYFQSVAIIGLCAVPLPPIVQSWTQDFSWSIGVIRVAFLQRMATWYQRTTGGTPATILATLGTKSVEVAKRSLGKRVVRGAHKRIAQGVHALSRRSGVPTTASGEYIVTGISRVAFQNKMEPTNLFLTSVTWYCIFVIFTLVGITLLKNLCELAVRAKWVKTRGDRLKNFREGWHVTLKGVIIRLILIGYPPLAILSLWEFTQDDSPAEIILAVVFFFGMSGALGYAAFKVTEVAKRSGEAHKTPAFLLYSDATVWNKWGSLYVQFRASAYFYIAPMLAYILVKAMFVGLAQKSGITQAVALIVIEAVALIGASVVRPWMDKSANAINIAICSINFANAIFLLIFTNVFNGPGLLIGVVGVVFFIANCVFALVLLIIVLVASAFSITRSNPETRYQPIADNRASFIKSQTVLTTELEALGYSARGDGAGEYKDHSGLEDSDRDAPSVHSPSFNGLPNKEQSYLEPSYHAHSNPSQSYQEPSYHTPSNPAQSYHVPSDQEPSYHAPSFRAPSNNSPSFRAPSNHAPSFRNQ